MFPLSTRHAKNLLARMRIAEMVVKIHAFLTSALDGGEWLRSHSGCYDLGETDPVPAE
jgi:hypothetical protein